MDSSYFGESNLGNERGGSSISSSSSSSRKGKKNNSQKPKQPQRGLGVAQLEKIRLHGQMGSNYHPSLQTPYPANFNWEDMKAQTAAYASLPSSSFAYSSSSSASSASYGFHPSVMMGIGDYERSSFRYGDSQPSTTASWTGNSIFEAQHFAQPSATRHLLNLQAEDSQQNKNKKHRSSSKGSSSQNSESSDTQELDLELRLSI